MMTVHETNVNAEDTDASDAASHCCAPSPASVKEPAQEAVRLRAATADDAAALALAGAATFLEAFTWMLPGADIVAHCAKHHTAAAYEKYFSASDTRVVLAEVLCGAPVGYMMLTAPELPSFDVQASDVELKRIYLFSRFRSLRTPVLDERGEVMAGLRVGQALMEAAVREARALGRTRLLLGTHAGNERAIAFYARNGFRVAGTRTFQVGAQVCDDLIFAKPLT